MNDNSDNQWIKASDAYRRLTCNAVSPHEAAAMLAAYLRDGQLSARATYIWKSSERFTSAAWKSMPAGTSGGKIPTSYWRKEKNITEDREQWRWPVSRFLVTTHLKPRRRIMMRGVSFLLSDLQQIQPATFGNAPGKTKRGRPVDLQKRDTGWLVVLELALNGGLTRQKLKTQTALQAALLERLDPGFGKLTLGETAINQIAQLVWRTLPTDD